MAPGPSGETPVPDGPNHSPRDAPPGDQAESGSLVAFPRTRSPKKRPPDNLPLELSSFVGREREITEIELLLGGIRLVTLHCPERNAKAVAVLCGKLDGIPLAIELAAARVRALTVEQISQKLEDPLSFLSTGSRTAPPVTRRCGGPSSGATSCSTSRSRSCWDGSRCSRGVGIWRPPKRLGQKIRCKQGGCWICSRRW